MREAEEFWDELFAQIEARQVIPIVGPELLTVVEASREIPLYHQPRGNACKVTGKRNH